MIIIQESDAKIIIKDAGIRGPQGIQGEQGIQGIQGPQGVPGQDGADGLSGSVVLEYKAKTSSTSGDPSSGYILWNNATQTSATAINIDHLTVQDVDIDYLLLSIKLGDRILIGDRDNSDNTQLWQLTADPTFFDHANGSYASLPVSLVSSTGTGTTGFSNNHSLSVVWRSAGVVDHGALTGLSDDDHLQYHNDARGDARYAPISVTGVTNLSVTNRGVSTLDIASSTGTAATIPQATGSLAGLQSAADKAKEDTLWTIGPDIASAATMDIGSSSGDIMNVTGNTPISAFTSAAAGVCKKLILSATTAITHNATSLILPNGVSLTLVAGSCLEFLSLGGGNWRCTSILNAPLEITAKSTGPTILAIQAGPKGSAGVGATSYTIPRADATHAGIISAAEWAVLNVTSGTNTGDQSLAGLQPLDTGLTSLAGLTGVGYIKETATDAFSVVATIPSTDITGLGTLATQSGTFSGTSSGTNTGDQALSIGIITAATIAINLSADGGASLPSATASLAGLQSAADKTKLDAISGTNTGDQTITLTGDVTGSGTGSFATTIALDSVTNTKLANMATSRIKGRTSAGTGDPEDLTASQARAVLGLATIATSASAADLTSGTLLAARMPALTGDVTSTVGTVGTTIAPGAVTLAKQAPMATGSVVYRKTAGSGDPEVQTLATLKADLGLTGTNTGDQTSIVGISGTLAQFNTAVTDADLVPTGAIGSSGLTMSTARLLGRSNAATGAIEEITLGTNLSFTGATLNAAGGGGATNLSVANITATTLDIASDTGTDATIPAATASAAGLATAAQITKLNAISGTNTGDQTSIVGITGTKAQFDTAVTDGNIMYIGDAPTSHTHTASEVTDFNSATRAQVEAELVAGTNITLTPSGSGASRQITIAASGGGGGLTQAEVVGLIIALG